MLWKRGNRYWTKFWFNGVRVQKPLKSSFTGRTTTDRREAWSLEKEVIAAVLAGTLPAKLAGSRGVKLFKAGEEYLAALQLDAAPGTIQIETERLVILKRELGDMRLNGITAQVIERFQQKRKAAGVGPRTINMDVSTLRKILQRYKLWRLLEDEVKFLNEKKTGEDAIGRALTLPEQQHLIATARGNPDWEHVWCAAVLAANTSMRGVELKHLRRRHVNLAGQELDIRTSKNEGSKRRLPLNADALDAVRTMLRRSDKLGHTDPEHFLWCACENNRYDPMKAITSWRTAWRSLTDAAGLEGFRFHDLRHTVITRLLEQGAPDHVIQSITGHLSKRMLEHYSHIRMQAKRDALKGLECGPETVPGTVPEPAQDSPVQRKLRRAK